MSRRAPQPDRYVTRRDAIARVQTRLSAGGYPRVVVLFIVALAGGIAFLFSAIALRLGLEQMGVRYFLATLAGYAAFLLLIRVWIAIRRGFDADHDVAAELAGNTADAGVRTAVDPPGVAFAGGRGGGGGGGASWGAASSSGRGTLDLPDADELWPVVLAIACAVGAVVAVLSVIYAAPLLLAEVALDAAIVGSVYRRLRREDARHWLDAAFRRTWLPALAVGVLMLITGFALQWAAPGAQSIGGAIRAISQK